jgi:hypothetical protein
VRKKDINVSEFIYFINYCILPCDNTILLQKKKHFNSNIPILPEKIAL